ncbi:hypothetical protein [Streptomyces sp. NBC_01766]|uniref:hypothetical protein n=1 Tax=Streptomyces sp. NBC_01766 TaxID=2975936 RepID=UPI002DDA56F8|nr:hypothetical protein [Streptomyces sp. NBC_01766]WSC24939.1 hypothetical protein OIE60_35335 [Streptomyces sp. NBC_01766]
MREALAAQLGEGGDNLGMLTSYDVLERAARWAADWDADPEGMRERCWNWRLCSGQNSGSGMWAQSVASATSRARRESAGQRWAERLAGNTVDQILAGADVSPAAISHARSRAAGLATAAQHQARFDAYVLDTLRGIDLDTTSPAPVSA